MVKTNWENLFFMLVKKYIQMIMQMQMKILQVWRREISLETYHRRSNHHEPPYQAHHRILPKQINWLGLFLTLTYFVGILTILLFLRTWIWISTVFRIRIRKAIDYGSNSDPKHYPGSQECVHSWKFQQMNQGFNSLNGVGFKGKKYYNKSRYSVFLP